MVLTLLNTEIFLSLCVCVILIYGVFVEKVVGAKKINLFANLKGLIVFSFLCVGWLWFDKLNVNITFWNSQLVSDKLYCLFAFFILGVVLLSVLLPMEYSYSYEYYILLLVYVLASFLILSANDFTIFYLAIELQAFAIYILIALNMHSTISVESAYKYFIVGALGSFFLLIGGVILYGTLGTLNYTDWSLLLFCLGDGEYTSMLLLGLGFLVAGILLKLALAPFHFWVGDVYEGCTWNVLFLVAIVNKITLVVALIRLLNIFYEFSFVSHVLLIVSFLSLIFGISGALQQLNLKRFFAYTGIVNLGYLAGALSVMTYTAFFSTIFYLIIYLLNFTAFIALILLVKDRIRGRYINSLVELGFLVKVFPVSALLLALLLFSFGGIPPLAGFFSKFLLLFSLLEEGAYLPFIFVTLSSIVSIFYYIRLVKKIYFLPQKEYVFWGISTKSLIPVYLVLVIVFINIFFVLKPYLLFLIVDDLIINFWLGV